MNKTIDKVLNQPISSSGYVTAPSGSTAAAEAKAADSSIIETYCDYEFKGDITEFKLK